MADDIGSVKGISGNSMSLNGQAGQGAVKCKPAGNGNPGGTKPTKEAEASVPMPK
jgi:hypothetical protein